ncbi:MAG TPA: glycosyltransferase family 4 protein [Tepidisphaeraceae bacterium]|jgi:glycosyltransferase involved in cell wall biosynthesis
MRIAYLVNRYPQASHSFIRREIAALEAMGVEIERISIRKPTAVVDPADQAEQKRTFIIFEHLAQAAWWAILWAIWHPIKTLQAVKVAAQMARSGGGWIKQIQYVIEGLAVAYRLAQRGISFLHVHFGTNSAAVGMYAKIAGGANYSLTVHGPEEFDAPERLGLGKKIQYAGFVVAISEFGRSQLFRWSRIEDWQKIHVVHCGLDRDFLRAQISSVADTQRLVSVGRLSEQKGQVVLLRAFAQVIQSGYRAQLVIVGDGPMRKELEQLIAELGVGDYVTITGWQTNSQVRDHILSGRAMVLPSFAEGLPVVIMEALALQRPVISTFVAGIPELVEHGVNGWLVPAGAVDRLAKCMIEALETSPEKLAEMGKAGALRVAAEHDADIEAQKLATLFSKHFLADEVRMIATSNAEAI